MMNLRSAIAILIGCSALGCDEIPNDDAAGRSSPGGGAPSGAGGSGGSPFEKGTLLEVPSEPGPVYVDLDAPAVVTASDAWELEIDNLDVFTNGGASGSGSSKAFGPLDAVQFIADGVPSDIPFMIEDEPGGAFFDWYEYDGGTHALYSRYHVIGVRRGEELFKVQVLGYYGEVEGAPISALYQLRTARVTAQGVEATTLWENVDGTAGGGATDADPSGCIVLSTGARLALTPAEAAASSEWDLCFRRDSISVNGEEGGPGGVEAVNLQAAALATETLEEVKDRTAASELAAFEGVDHAVLTTPGLAWRGDGVVSAFSGKWLEPGKSPLEPVRATWLVAGSDGETPFFVAFDGFTGSTASSVGTIQLRVKRIGGSLP
jgi:hypothetical protein